MINRLKFLVIVSIALIISSCTIQSKSTNGKEPVHAETHKLFDKKIAQDTYDAFDIVSNGYLDSSGIMWFATLTQGVFRYDGKSFTNFKEKDGLCDNDVSTVIEDREGILWFGTASGLCRYDGKTFVTIPIPKDDFANGLFESIDPGVDPIGVTSLIQDKKGIFWIGSDGSGVYRYDEKIFTSFLKKKGIKMTGGLHHNVISSIIEDHAGNIWFSSFSRGGITKYDGKTFIDYGIEDGLGDDMIFSGYIDASGNLWFGTRDGGISIYNGETFRTIHLTEGPCENFMSSVFEDKTGRYWVAGFDRSGMCWFDGKIFTKLKIENSEKIKDIKFFSEDKEGNVWFGGRHGMLWRYDGEFLKNFTYEMRL